MTHKTHIMRCMALILMLEMTATVMAQPGGLVGYWKLDDMAGSTAVDSSGNGNNGELLNDPTWVEGLYNGALQFAPTAPSLSVPFDDMTPDGGTVAMWVYLDANQSTDTTYFFGHTTLPYGNRIQLYTEDSNLDLGLGDSHAVRSSIIKLQTEVWFHLALTWDNGNYVLYLDGQSIAEGSYTGLTELQERAEFGNNGSGNADQALNGILDDVWLFSRAITESELAVVMAGGSDLTFASAPSPADEETDVAQVTDLTWAAGAYAASHDVYWGTIFDDVNEASRDNPGNVLVSQGQTDTSYALGRLELGQTYFWRIDEVNATPDHFIYKGKVWRFTVEPVSYALAGASITATASSTNNPDTTGPGKTIDGSGLDETDGHSTTPSDMWLSATGDGSPWIQYAFDRVYKLDHMLIWNSNQLAEDTVGWGLMDVQIETSLDGDTWTVVEGVARLTQASGNEGVGPTDDIALGGLSAKYVRIDIASNWGGLLQQYSLSEVRFMTIPTSARKPSPESGATDVAVDANLSWRAGREAAEHILYIGSDEQSVIDGTANVVTLSQASYGPLSLDLAKTYYWRIDEVNNAEATPIWVGDTWRFTTQEYLVVEDFESYNDITEGEEGSNLVYLTWIDGYDNPTTNGSTMGYATGNSMETTIVHGGSQSVPLMYDNSTASISEVTVNTSDLPIGQDWTVGSPAVLTLWFYGDPNNAGTDRIYVKVNGVKRIYDGDLAQAQWQEFSVDLASLGINLGNVTSLTIGFESNGSGMVFIDDIQLYTPAILEQ